MTKVKFMAINTMIKVKYISIITIIMVKFMATIFFIFYTFQNRFCHAYVYWDPNTLAYTMHKDGPGPDVHGRSRCY